jgi:prolipoprotein diacylglyceryltransferase
MLYCGLVVAVFAGDWFARRSGIDSARWVAAFLLLTPVCLAGARALTVALNWRHFRAHPSEILRLERGGAAMYGALFVMLPFTVPVTRWLEIPFGAFWDIAVVGMLAGMVPTRFGCLFNGCCAGRPVAAWRGTRFPNQLVEAAVGGVLLALLILFQKDLPFPGAACLLGVSGYAAARFGLEWLREQRAPSWGGLRPFQWISLVLLVPCAVGLIIGWAATEHPATLLLAASSHPAAESPVLLRIASAALLVPVMMLFRFLGCDLVLGLEPPPGHPVRLGAVVPDVGGTGGFTATMKIFAEPGMVEISGSPFDLTVFSTLPGGRFAFEVTAEIAEGTYSATCTVSRAGAPTRERSCSGAVTGPGLEVFFSARPTDPATFLDVIRCFEAP